MTTAPPFFSVPTPCPVKSSVLRWRPVLSRFPTRVQRSNRSTRKKTAACEQSKRVKLRSSYKDFCTMWSLIGCSVTKREKSKEYSTTCAHRDAFCFLGLDSYQTSLDYNDTKTKPSVLRHLLLAQPGKENSLEIYPL